LRWFPRGPAVLRLQGLRPGEQAAAPLTARLFLISRRDVIIAATLQANGHGHDPLLQRRPTTGPTRRPRPLGLRFLRGRLALALGRAERDVRRARQLAVQAADPLPLPLGREPLVKAVVAELAHPLAPRRQPLPPALHAPLFRLGVHRRQ